MELFNILFASLALSIFPQGTNDMTAAVMAAVDKVRANGGGRIVFAPGDYHFRSPQKKNWYVSNHRNPTPREVFLPITNISNTVFESKRAEFIFHGGGLGFALVDCGNVTLRGISFDYSRPYNTEWRLVELENGEPVLETDPEIFPFAVKEGMLYNDGECWHGKETLAFLFDAQTHQLISVGHFGGGCERISERRIRLKFQSSKWRYSRPLRPGTIYVTRCTYRPNPAVLLYRAHSTLFEDVIVRASGGMGIIAQRCSGVTIRGTGSAKSRSAGAMARKGSGRVTSMQADATHFSNCKGLITVENCYFEGMVDDAINVHSTCLKIEKVISSDRLLCRYMHHESFGFETFLPGERLRFIRVESFEPGMETVVKDVKWHDPTLVELTLAEPVPAQYKAGDAVENALWQPSVVFSRNVVSLSTPRATLFTTPGRVVCESNLFDRVGGQPIHLSGDAADWYESGACRDVTIRGNVFKECFTQYKGGRRGLITVNPNIKDIGSQKERYHRNILVEGNTFDCGDIPLVWAWSVSNFVWRANAVRRPSDSKTEPFIFEHSDDIRLKHTGMNTKKGK
ncbi:MAG: right-handed parallel beta-helix repeat-containing protein [Kiritimatiellae bacterium]|nr:right-handed parallel beta-helix repeat-containing protein [Kiritimatiellia bacterium]